MRRRMGKGVQTELRFPRDKRQEAIRERKIRRDEATLALGQMKWR